MNSLEAKREKMLSLVEAWRSSGQTQKQFCAKHGLKLGTFTYWVTQSRLQPITGFVAIPNPAIEDKVKGSTQKGSTQKGSTQKGSTQELEVIYPNGVRVRIQPSIEADLSLLSQ
ncbi:IS66 family insertion sequence element accessory protein TnpA, partial [Xanthocytophaga flava]|uniref:IS66 family insertion sequence element accessory protein TnpA n=1 Tax=Xanthocytophaga flava TaxID=3048013 RepID=UPI0028D0A3D2